MSHCFISYSNRDAEHFGAQLANELEGGNPYIEAWFDKRDIPAGSTWRDKVPDAIKACKCLLFALTKDSITDESICGHELDLALRYKMPILIVRLQTGVEPPFRLGEVQWIDFHENRKAGMAKLRLAVQRLDLPEGQLDALKARLSAANRDLSNAKTEEEKLRIQVDVEDLTKQIQVQQKIVDNPKAAEEQTQKNIEAGLERERKPEKPVAAKTETKFINPPPGIAPNYFQDRQLETVEIVKSLQDESRRMMTIVGRGGVGKTAMICRLLKGLESGELPDGLGGMKVDGIVYLSESGSHRVNFANIFYDLCKLLPSEVSQELDAVYKNPQGSTESKMLALLEKFSSGRVVLLLDNFEPLVDTETLTIRDAELDEALRAFLNGPHTTVDIVITTRAAPQALNLKVQPGRQRVLTLDEGLESPYAENILREMDSDGRVGLKSASADLLSRARERTRGYPRALEALFAILASDRYTTLEELLAMPTPENVVEALVGEAFNRLDMNAQKVMQALAVYNRPVTPAAVDYLLTPHLPAIDSAPILQRLANMHFARKESGRFYLHPVDREFAFGLIAKELTTKDTKVTKEKQRKTWRSSRTSRFNAFTQHDLTTRAADYFAQARKPRAEWKKLDDLAAQLAEFDLRCTAGDYDTAASVLLEIDFDYLLLWGHYLLTIDLHKKLQEKLVDSSLRRISTANLGSAYYRIGKTQEAVKYYYQVLELARGNKDRQHEGAILGNLGNAYINLGNAHKAMDFYEQALLIAREISDLRGEGARLNGIGNSYLILGDPYKAIEYYEQALSIFYKIDDKQSAENALGNLGSCYNNLGDIRKALEYYEQALLIDREIGDRGGESIDLENVGHTLLSLEEYQKAKDNYQQAIQIADEISLPNVQLNARWGLAQVYLFQNDLVNARATIEAALQYDVPENNHNATALHGIIALRQKESETAQEAFTKSITQADEILAKTPEYYDALDAKGLALCGRAVSRESGIGNRGERDAIVVEAMEVFRKARKIAPHAGVVKSVLRLFDELVKCDEEGVLKGVREVIEGS